MLQHLLDFFISLLFCLTVSLLLVFPFLRRILCAAVLHSALLGILRDNKFLVCIITISQEYLFVKSLFTSFLLIVVDKTSKLS